MSCILSVYGSKLNIDTLILNSKLKPYKKYYKGNPISKSDTDLSFSYFTVLVSKGGFYEFDKQIDEAIQFLKKNKKKILQISLVREVEGAGLIFSIKSTIDTKITFTQNSYFPKKLIKLASDLGIEIQLSVHYKRNMW